MSVVPDVYDVHGWHEFQPSGLNGEDWCALCDCLITHHVSREEYDRRRSEFEESARRFQEADDQDRGVKS